MSEAREKGRGRQSEDGDLSDNASSQTCTIRAPLSPLFRSLSLFHPLPLFLAPDYPFAGSHYDNKLPASKTYVRSFCTTAHQPNSQPTVPSAPFAFARLPAPLILASSLLTVWGSRSCFRSHASSLCMSKPKGTSGGRFHILASRSAPFATGQPASMSASLFLC